MAAFNKENPTVTVNNSSTQGSQFATVDNAQYVQEMDSSLALSDVNRDLAVQAAVEALASQVAADASEQAALASQIAAALSEANASASEIAAAASAAAALISQQTALASEQAALGSEQAALASEQAALASEQASATSAAASASSALTAQSLLVSFNTKYLGEYATDPTLDPYGDPLVDGQLYLNTTLGELKFYNNGAWVNPEADTLASATAAANSATASANSATASANSATASASSAAASLVSEQNALASEQAALSSEQAALASEQAALASEQAAQSAQSQTQALFDAFGDQYLGPHTTAPTTDLDGSPLETGDIYWDSTNNVLNFWNGTSWTEPSTIATNAAAAALASQSAAATSEANASASATASANSASAASQSASAASTSETNATASASAASTSEGNAAASAGASATSASASAASATAALASEQAASASATAAAGSATSAASSATSAANSASAAAQSATDAQGYATAFLNSEAYNITSTDTANWDTAYGWGDHGTVGYLTSYTETDPIYTASSWYTTTNNSSNWDTAYGWGDHGAAGYVVDGSAATLSSLQLTGGTGTQGTFSWNTDEETVDLVLDGATLQLGQEVHYHVRNNTASAIPNGTAVYATGTLGASGRITVAPFLADGTIPAKYFIGITTEEIAAGADGKVTDFGKVRNIDTNAYNDGDVLYPSSTTAGGLTNVAPSSPALAIPCAFVVYSGNNGNIFVRVHPQDENAYATYSQGALADSAVQPGDNVSTLTNDASYATTSYVDTAESDAVTTANSYTDTRETAITSAYQSADTVVLNEATSRAMAYAIALG